MGRDTVNSLTLDGLDYGASETAQVAAVKATRAAESSFLCVSFSSPKPEFPISTALLSKTIPFALSSQPRITPGKLLMSRVIGSGGPSH